jgi:hypothetical protein
MRTIQVLLQAGLQIGHLPTMVGTDAINPMTQPPGILSWAAFTAYNRTGNKAFLATACVTTLLLQKQSTRCT